MGTSRRSFMVGCSAAIASLGGARFKSLTFGAQPGDDVLVVLFLRGGIDGLNWVVPTTHSDRGRYEQARPTLAVPASGSNSARSIGGGFGMHPAASGLRNIFQDGNVAVVHATGMINNANRSHFDAMEFIELGTPGEKSTFSGWLARHLSALDLPSNVPLPAVSIGNLQQTSLRGSIESVNMSSISSFNLDRGPYQWRDQHRAALRSMISNGNSEIHVTCEQALDAIDVIELNSSGGYTPANGAQYPGGSLGDHFEAVAQMVKLGLGLRVAAIDFGGWDTHNGQGDNGGGYFSQRLGELSQALEAFYTDLDGNGANNFTDCVTVAVQSEFGRRLRQNANRGTDHGYGNVMLLMGGSVNGGLYGQWPGLATGQLFDQADLNVTTDYRQVFSEILIRRFGNADIDTVFPGYAPDYIANGPLGIMQGSDIPVNLGPPLFGDGFESGGGGGWDQMVE
ncbi:MAG: DUF1501 domain-containing protein [Acidobacteriota bacterium]